MQNHTQFRIWRGSQNIADNKIPLENILHIQTCTILHLIFKQIISAKKPNGWRLMNYRCPCVPPKHSFYFMQRACPGLDEDGKCSLHLFDLLNFK